MIVSTENMSLEYLSQKAMLWRLSEEHNRLKFWIPKVFYMHSKKCFSVPNDFTFKVFKRTLDDHVKFIGVEFCEEYNLDYEE